MIKIYTIFLFIIPLLTSKTTNTDNNPRAYDNQENEKTLSIENFENYIERFYTGCDFQNKLSFDAFRYAIIGYYNLNCAGKLKNNNILTIIDYTKSSNQKRLFVIDIKKEAVITSSLVAHGKACGDEYAQYFSNMPHSKKSSIGFFITGETYNGKHMYSLKIDGLEYTNNNARNRGIVFHGANYVSNEFIKHNGRIGRSNGCPALPQENNKKIVDKIKEGTCLFIYYPDFKYVQNSVLLDFENALQEFNEYTYKLSLL